MFAFSPYTLQRDPGLYRWPQMFDPGRWPPAGTRNTDGRSLLAFGMGARDCIGEAFAWRQLTAVLTAVTGAGSCTRMTPTRPSQSVTCCCTRSSRTYRFTLIKDGLDDRPYPRPALSRSHTW
ncbi:MAG: cytochrome P450 [Streptosporangiaceae bacterium]|nr:cytochrome P450 [Streptosporangiaceae bacterium]